MAILFATETSAGEPITFKFVRGTKWDDSLQLTDQATGDPVDLTDVVGITLRIRTAITSSTVLLELSVANERITVTDATTGAITISVGTAVTVTLPANGQRKAKYVYDALIERTTGEYEPAIGGKVIVLPSVTRLADDE